MSFTYTQNIPLASNSPSADQPNMQVNTNSISNWAQIDHVGFNTATAGQHVQCTFPTELSAAPTPSGSVGIVYPLVGIADNTHPQILFANANASFPMTLVKAYANFTGSTGAILSSQSINVASVTRVSTGSYNVVLNANVVSGTSYSVYVAKTGSSSSITVTITSATAFSIVTGGGDPTTVSFVVTQL